MSAIKAGIVGGVILFIWGFISWMVLPWHQASIRQFKDVQAVSKVIEENAPRSGIYLIPNHFATEKVQGSQTEPMVFASVNQKGMNSSMVIPMLIGLLTQIIAACFVAWMLLQTNFGYSCRVWFVVVFGIAAGIVSQIPSWNWLGFDINYAGIMFADLIIGWFLAGLVMAGMIRSKRS